jgi:hypothetical protein
VKLTVVASKVRLQTGKMGGRQVVGSLKQVGRGRKGGIQGYVGAAADAVLAFASANGRFTRLSEPHIGNN